MEIAPRKPGRPKDPELESRRRAQILDTAAKVFAGFGFAGTQVQVFADRLGVGNGTVYRYFPTKEILFLAAVERGLEELTAEMDAVMTEPLEPLDTLRRLVRVYLGFFHRRPEMAELFIQERAAFPHHHRPLYFARREQDGKECRRADLFHRLIASGRIRSISQERFFAVIGDLLYGTILTNLLTGRRATPDAQTEDVLDVILNGILAEEGEDR
jgi:AcrR family transcriptional regulator